MGSPSTSRPPSRRAPRGAALPGLLAFLVAVVLLALFPQWVRKPYVLNMGAVLFLAVIQGQAWNIVGGYCGQYSVGHAAYFGIGAYVTMMLLEVGKVAPWVGIWPAMGAAVLVSMVIGSITFRLRGPYFVLASISVAEIMKLATLHFKDLTRGAEGFLVSEIPTLTLFGSDIDFVSKRTFYQVGLAVAVITIGVNWAVQHSKAGYYFQAIREDQDAAHSLGINLTGYKVLALGLSAAFAAFAGGFYAMFVKFISPEAVFGIEVSVQMVLICIIGGIGTIIGPVVGALVLVPLSEVLRNPRGLAQIGLVSADSPVVRFIEARLSNAHMLVYGILVVLVILFAPDGALGLIRAGVARLKKRLARAPASAPAAQG